VKWGIEGEGGAFATLRAFWVYIETMWQTVDKVELNCEAGALVLFTFAVSQEGIRNNKDLKVNRWS
jgi:hypothetical protein